MGEVARGTLMATPEAKLEATLEAMLEAAENSEEA